MYIVCWIVVDCILMSKELPFKLQETALFKFSLNCIEQLGGVFKSFSLFIADLVVLCEFVKTIDEIEFGFIL
jgi:hypothetical protein